MGGYSVSYTHLDVYKRQVQNYFVGVLSKRQDGRWLQALEGPVDQRLLDYFGKTHRNMWCTGGFLHTAGLTVNCSGDIVPCLLYTSRCV